MFMENITYNFLKRHVVPCSANLLEQKKVFTYQKSKEVTDPTRLVWHTNMAAVSLFWNANMAAMTSCAYARYYSNSTS